MRTFIQNITHVTADGLRSGIHLLVEDDKVLHIDTSLPSNSAADLIIDGQDLILTPGLIDLHVHGGGGADFADGTPEAFALAARTHLQHGTTALMPALVACAPEEMDSVFLAYRDTQTLDEPLPHFLGIHIEGPYLAKERAGALDPRFLHAPNPEEYIQWLGRWKELKRMTIAPELEGALPLIDAFVKEGRMVSFGHSDASYDAITQAVKHGCELVTHLYSTMSTIHRVGGYRYLGLIETALLLDELFVEVIADGCHLPKELLRLIVKTKPQERIILVTDAMRAAGTNETISVLGSLAHGLEVLVEDGVAKLPDRSAFAGSVATADRLIRVMVQEAGVPLHLALSMMTANPARLLGRDDLGSLQVNGRADFVLWDETLHIRHVYLHGKQVQMEKEEHA